MYLMLGKAAKPSTGKKGFLIAGHDRKTSNQHNTNDALWGPKCKRLNDGAFIPSAVSLNLSRMLFLRVRYDMICHLTLPTHSNICSESIQYCLPGNLPHCMPTKLYPQPVSAR